MLPFLIGAHFVYPPSSLPAEIQSLVMRGKVSDAVRVVRASYPNLLDSNLELLFTLKCRQFVEMIAGYDTADLASTPGRGDSRQVRQRAVLYSS